jgi:hypothetical protein
MATETLIYNLDSRFREDPQNTTSSFFTIILPTPIHDVKSVRLASIEVPNVFYVFGDNTNTIFQVRRTGYANEWKTVKIIPGNYGAFEIRREISYRATLALGIPLANRSTTGPIQFTINEFSGRALIDISSGFDLTDISFGGEGVSDLDFNWTPLDLNQVYSYYSSLGTFTGLSGTDLAQKEYEIYSMVINEYIRFLDVGGFNLRDILGFSDFLLYGKSTYQSANFINTAGDQYLLLRLNDYEVVTHILKGNELLVFAKIPIRAAKNFVEISTGASAITRVKLFEQPQTIYQFTIEILNGVGKRINLNNLQVSLTLEVERIILSKDAEVYRNSRIKAGDITSPEIYETKRRLRNWVNQ